MFDYGALAVMEGFTTAERIQFADLLLANIVQEMSASGLPLPADLAMITSPRRRTKIPKRVTAAVRAFTTGIWNN